jgi:hypothetical protein
MGIFRRFLTGCGLTFGGRKTAFSAGDVTQFFADPVNQCLAVLVEMEKSFDFLAIDLFKPEVVVLINQRELTSISILENGLTPENLVSLLIGNVTFAKLSGGHHHMYRGVLSHEGQLLKHVFLLVNKLRLEKGYISKREFDEDVCDVSAAISKVG